MRLWRVERIGLGLLLALLLAPALTAAIAISTIYAGSLGTAGGLERYLKLLLPVVVSSYYFGLVPVMLVSVLIVAVARRWRPVATLEVVLLASLVGAGTALAFGATESLVASLAMSAGVSAWIVWSIFAAVGVVKPSATPVLP
jgi:hypothetical protein